MISESGEWVKASKLHVLFAQVWEKNPAKFKGSVTLVNVLGVLYFKHVKNYC